jgi:hypothetical protein
MKLFSHPPLRGLALALLALPLAASAATVTGTVTNKTTNKPDGSDDVILLSLSQGMQESGRTKPDAQGHFSIEVPDGAMHLLRVDHQKAPYFAPVPPGTTTADIDVYDAAPQVKGVAVEANVIRVETDPSGLHVVENYFVKNDSTPPVTQFSDHSFEIYIQPGAQIEGSAAAGPGGMPVAASPLPLSQKGHYAFSFPLRPGESRFQLSYHIPYNGSYKFIAHELTDAQNVAILLPKSMKFDAGSSPFQAINDGMSVQTFLARGVKAGAALDFTVSGTGSQPREEQGAQGQQSTQAAAGQAGPEAGPEAGPGQGSAAQDNRPGGGLGNPIDTPDPLQKYRWWIISGLAILLVIAAAFFLRAKPGQPQTAIEPPPNPLVPTSMPAGTSTYIAAATPPPNGTVAPGSYGSAPGSNALLAALKDELFTLESERLEGKLTDAEYAELKSALEVVLRRALARQTLGR